MDDDYEKKGSKSEKTFGDWSLVERWRANLKITKLSLSDLELKMERLTKPLLQWDFQYFMDIGLSSYRTNPLRLKVRWDAAHDEFGKAALKISIHKVLEIPR
jgi:hypothetical protein